MDATKLSNKQLYAISRNKRLDASIQHVVMDELRLRNLPLIEADEDVLLQQAAIDQKSREPLEMKFRLLLIICPFFLELQSLIAGRLLANGQKRKYAECWKFIMAGLLLWTVVIIFLAKKYLGH